MADKTTTLSVFTAGVGGLVGDVSSHPGVVDNAREKLAAARDRGAVTDYHVARCGDDLELIITHEGGIDDSETHRLAWNTFVSCRAIARDLKLYGSSKALADRFPGNMRGIGPGVAEIEFAERESEPVVVFLANKTGRGAWNLPLYRIFADPFNSASLLGAGAMSEGFNFTLLDTWENRAIELRSPGEAHLIVALASFASRYVITSVSSTDGTSAAAISSLKKDFKATDAASGGEPALIVRCHGAFPPVGEVMEAFSFPHLVSGATASSHAGPLMPVPFYEANPTRLDGPPRVISAGFQLSGGHLIGPHDMFDDPGFDEARKTANTVTDYLRRHGPFQAAGPASAAQAREQGAPAVFDSIKTRFRKQ